MRKQWIPGHSFFSRGLGTRLIFGKLPVILIGGNDVFGKQWLIMQLWLHDDSFCDSGLL